MASCVGYTGTGGPVGVKGSLGFEEAVSGVMQSVGS